MFKLRKKKTIFDTICVVCMYVCVRSDKCEFLAIPNEILTLSILWNVSKSSQYNIETPNNEKERFPLKFLVQKKYRSSFSLFHPTFEQRFISRGRSPFPPSVKSRQVASSRYRHSITSFVATQTLTLRPALLLCMLTACMNLAVAPVPGGDAPCRNRFAILEADLTSSPQPPHLKEFLADSVSNETDMVVKDEGEMSADGEGGSLRGGVAHEHAARLPREHPRASRQTAAAADIA